MNILLSSAGRRSYLVHYFKMALEGRGRVIVANSIADAPAMFVADKAYSIPYVWEPGYLESVLDICRKEKIGALFSLHDLEGPVLASNREKFLDVGTFPVISAPGVIRTCLDKYEMRRFLDQHDIGTPITVLDVEQAQQLIDEGALTFPLILKPRFGFGSTRIMEAANKHELLFLYHYIEQRLDPRVSDYLGVKQGDPEVVVQEKIAGDEYGIEVVNDLHGNYLGTMQKRKRGMRAGETDSAVTVRISELEKLGQALSRRLRHIGLLDTDVFHTNGGFRVLECNPRFGGQYPFSHLADSNVLHLLLNLLEHGSDGGMNLEYRDGVFGYKDIEVRFGGTEES